METFNITPQYIWDNTSAYNVISTEFESGKKQRKYLGTLPREWGLTFKGNWETISAVQAFYDARKGSFESFSWTPPGASTAIIAIFKENSLTMQRQGLTSFGECSVTIEEVL